MKKMKAVCTLLLGVFLILCYIDLTLSRGVRFGGYRGGYYRSYYSGYRSYRYYYYYYSYTLSTGAIVGIVIGSIVGIALFIACCIFCCACCCAFCEESSASGNVNQQTQQPVSTISSSNSTFNNLDSTTEPGVQFIYNNTEQYSTRYSAPPPSYDVVTSSGKINAGFQSGTS